jgi:hypothetical protein
MYHHVKRKKILHSAHIVLFLVFRSVFTRNSDLHSIKWSLFIIEMEYVYCAVRTESLNIIQVNFRLQALKGRWKTYCKCVCIVTLHHILVLWRQIKRSLKSLFTGHRESWQIGISFSLSSYVTILVLYVMSFNRKSLYSYFNSMAMVEKWGLSFMNNTRSQDLNIKRRNVHT